MKIQDWTQLHNIVVTSAIGLFSSVGWSADYGGSTPQIDVRLPGALSLIELQGQIRGSIILSVPPTLLADAHPTQSSDSAELTDWALELANLFLGRIKRALVTRGVHTQLSTPLSICSDDFGGVAFPAMPVAHAFHVRRETIYVVFGAMCSEHFSFAGGTVPSVVSVGGTVMF